MPTQEIQAVTKETQKIVLKTISEQPTLTVEELSLLLKSRVNKITQEEILQVIHSISPNKNWHRATPEDTQKEILDFIWTLETQILFLLPTKQKETTVAEFNQIRLQNKQSKVPKDLIRHIQAVLTVEGKNLGKFRKFQKDLSIQNDLDINIQAMWLCRIILANLNMDLAVTIQGLSSILVSEFKEKFPAVSEKVGKTMQRLCERFVEKYFPKNISETRFKELLSSYQTIFNTYKKSADGEMSSQADLKDQNKLIENIIEQLKEVQEIVNESHEGGVLSKLFSGKVKNKEGVIQKIDEVINSINEINNLNGKANKQISEKAFLVQKLQSDYENIVFVKNQLEHDLLNLNEKSKTTEERNANMEKELQDKTETIEKLHEKIASLQQKVEAIPGFESKANSLREELGTAKSIAISLYLRVNKIKDDLLKQNPDKSRSNKLNGEGEAAKSRLQNGTQTIHKIQQDQETGQTMMTTEVN